MDKWSSSIDYDFKGPNRVYTYWEPKGKGSGRSGRWITYYAENGVIKSPKYIRKSKAAAIKAHRTLGEIWFKKKHAHHKSTR
jgi:hypothetical protein